MPTKTFPGRYSSLADIAIFIRQAAEEAGLEGFAIYAVETAVDEACSNIIEHGYQGQETGEILCTTLTDNKGLTIILEDGGRPFDPSSIPDPQLDVSLDERKAHGLGLFFMRQLMDEVTFSTRGPINVLTMVKHTEHKTE